MHFEYGLIIAGILGMHFVAGYCHRQKYAARKGFFIGSCYASVTVVLFLMAGAAGNGVEATFDRVANIGPIAGFLAYIAIAGSIAAWPRSGSL